MDPPNESLWTFKGDSEPKPWDGWTLVKEKQLGKGAFSAVFLVRDDASGLHMALKKISKLHIYNEMRKNQFLREIKIHKKKNVPPVHCAVCGLL